MGRKPKYEFGTETITASLNKTVLDYIRNKAHKEKLSLSEMINRILESVAFSERDYHNVMAQHHARLMYIHKAEEQALMPGG